MIRESHSLKSSTVFSLVGPWGTGKTSILDWLARRAVTDERKPRWVTVKFNPWDYADPSSLQLGFFNELAAAFQKKASLSKVRSRVAAFGRAVAPLGVIGALAGTNMTEAIAAAADLVDPDSSAAASRAKLEKALVSAATPILVVIDDLDRVTAEELLLTLKLVRQLGRLPHVHYLLSYDESTVLDVLSRTSLVGKHSLSRAREYMEKVVQVRFDIPHLRPTDALRLTNRGLEELADHGGLSLSVPDTERFSTAYFSFLAERFNTPRALKRFFTQLRLLSASMSDELDLPDFFVLTWLRTLEPGVYALLQSHRGELTGSDLPRALARSDANREQLRARADEWRTSFKQAGTREKDLEGVASAVSYLFPAFASVWAGSSASSGARPRGVANEKYFDRYFSFGLTEDDVADATVRASIEAHQAGQNADEADAEIRRVIAFEPALVLDKVARELEPISRSSVSLIEWLASLHSAVPEHNDIIDPARRFEAILALQMRLLDAADTAASVRALAEQDATLMSIVVERACREYDGEPSSPVLLDDPTRGAFRTALNTYLSDTNPATMGHRERTAAWRWFFVDLPGFQLWFQDVRERVGDIDALCLFVNISTSIGTRTPISRLSGFDHDNASELLNLAEVRSAHEGELIDVEVPKGVFLDDPLDSAYNRRHAVYRWLREGE